MPFPKLPLTAPTVTTEQMIEVDRLMMDDYGIGLIQMMENAGRNLADLCRRRFLDADPRGRSVVVLAGPGGNGGGALVAARRLANWGAHVSIVLSKHEDDFNDVPRHQLRIVQRMGLRLLDMEALATNETVFELIVDGLIGYSLRGAPTGAAAHLIRWANTQSAPIVALDTPSGLDTNSGVALGPVIDAAATLTLALPKTGLLVDENVDFVGELYCADISVPSTLYAEPSLGLMAVPIFAENDIVRIF